MINNTKKIGILILGVGLTACSSFSPRILTSQTFDINKESLELNQINEIIAPYKDSLSKSMNLVIGFSEENLIGGRPCSYMNNWAADALLKNQDSLAQILKPNMSLLNVGGFRSAINYGEITVGEIFTVMPFDNLVVWVKMPIAALDDVAKYIQHSGGEPIGNVILTETGLKLLGEKNTKDYFWILTSDYLMNGGDKMAFFDQKLEVIHTDILLRDLFLSQVKKQGTLVVDKKCRINVE